MSIICERASYEVYIQRIEAITLQLQDIKQDLKAAVDYTTKLKDFVPGTNVTSLQFLTLTELLKNHNQDIRVIKEKLNRTIDLVLC